MAGQEEPDIMALAEEQSQRDPDADSPDASSTPGGAVPTSSQPLTQRLARAWRYVVGGSEPGSLEASIDAVFGEDRDGGASLSKAERDMFVNLLGFNELRTEDVMVPRPDIVAVEEGATLDELMGTFQEANHSRLPVYRETLDDPRGMVHIKDLLGWISETRGSAGGTPAPASFSVTGIRRDLIYVPPSMPAIDLLLKMQASRQHMALVIDEYGGTDGLVTIEDLVEQIVGEIEDEHDEEERPDLERLPDGRVDAIARAEIEELEEMLGLRLLSDDSEDQPDTLGGLIFDMLGRVPQRGEVVVHDSGIEFEVTDADPRRIKRLMVHPASAEDHQSTE
jgi:CBS domain containing-hemolysin-like protein